MIRTLSIFPFCDVLVIRLVTYGNNNGCHPSPMLSTGEE
jgi:hypothetical protein